MNYNTNFVKWISQSMALMDSVNVFFNLHVGWCISAVLFFRTSFKWSFWIFTVSQQKTKSLKWNTMNTTDEHIQIAKNSSASPTTPLMSKCFSRSRTCVTNSTGVFSRTIRLTFPLDIQNECISFFECNILPKRPQIFIIRD